MSKLLKGKRVLIDTQAFRKARFGVKDPAFAKFCTLCEHREVILVTTAITRREIDAQIDEVAPEIRSVLAKADRIAASLGQPEFVVLGFPATQLTELQVAAALKKLVGEFFENCAAEQLDLPKLALAKVLDLYFEKRPPFGAGKKKAEFPDAFVLEALKAKAGVNGQSIYVVSEDSDFASACKECSYLELVPTLAHFLDRYNSHAESVKQVRATLRKNSKKIDEKLDEIVNSLSGELDCAGSVQIAYRKIVDVLDSLIISCDEARASVEFVCFVEIDAWLEIRPPNDAPPEYRNAEKQQTINITLEFRFDPSNAAVFEVENYWAPQAISFSAHSAS
jgi:hypothetical protein